MVKMTAAEHLSDVYTRYTTRPNMYTSSPASSATASVCSDASSQFSHSSDLSTSTSFSDFAPHPYSLPDGPVSSCQQGFTKPQAQPAVSENHQLRGTALTGTWAAVPEVHWSLRQNARRTSNTATTRTGCPPPLVRQAERKLNFVDNLVGKPS